MHEILEEYNWYQDLKSPGRLIVARAVHEIDMEYGPDAERVKYPYFAHNGDHTRRALEDFAVLKDVLGMTEAEFMVGACAVAAHDIVKTFDREDGMDEKESAEWLAEELGEVRGLSPQMVAVGELAVIGTTAKSENGVLMQKTFEQEYPSKRAELIAHGVSGADLGRLFTPDGPLIGHYLYQEQQAADGNDPTAIEPLLEAQKEQLEVLLSYYYPNKDIETALATHKSSVIKYVSELIRMLEAGLIEDWEQLMSLDKLFIHQQ